jgi:ATP-binding cassette, subfamily B, bacterial
MNKNSCRRCNVRPKRKNQYYQMKHDFKPVFQYDSMDCGPACLCMIAHYYGKYYSLESLRKKSILTRQGVSLLGLSDAAESIGFRTTAVRVGFENLILAPMPCIVHWNQNHFVVLYDKNEVKKNVQLFVADPAIGKITYREDEFCKSWISTRNSGNESGIALILEPTPDFYQNSEEIGEKNKFRFLISYVRNYGGMIRQLITGLFAGSLLQLILPFLTQSIVDYGINDNNLTFIQIVLAAQLVLVISSSTIEFLRGWILLHLGTRINISLISDFLIKLMQLPMGYFDSKMTGDLLQRINDHDRIENFLTNSSLNTLFSLFNIIVFGIVLLFYSWKIFLVFFIGSSLYFLWVKAFIRQRKELDFKHFAKQSKNQSKLIQIVTGMQEIKLHGCEKQKRWEWENIQASIFKIRIKGLALRQYQDSGAVLINQTKNILITALAAGFVINGEMTLGMMLSVQYIIGQMNAPVDQIVNFLRSYQDAKLSLNRLSEIQNQPDEDGNQKTGIMALQNNIELRNIGFSYDGTSLVLDNISLTIPKGKQTAIVGMSGSGKTTLIKLLLGYYLPTNGEILVNSDSLSQLNLKSWRKICGIVMQDGLIFSESIAGNIATGDECIDIARLQEAAITANIHDFVKSLPLGYNTLIGAEGLNLSQGQKQRILIARAIYKNPCILFLDEATNALDANNEKYIMDKLQHFFIGRTVIVVAHRLSTVRNADQIVVIDKGKIAEKGTHEELIKIKGAYFNLVKNQLEL